MKIIERFKVDELRILLDDSKSFREFLEKIGSSSNGSGAYKSIKKQLLDIGIELKEFEYKNTNIIPIRLDDSEVFIENSTFSRQHLKKRIIKYKLIEYKCDKCNNNGSWLGEILSLQLEHRNGINNDNRIENLCFLCPNCHSQTDTFSGKSNKKLETKCRCGKIISKNSKNCKDCYSEQNKKVERPKLEKLIKDVEEIGYKATGRLYGVSDNTIRKWINKYTRSLA